MACPENALIYNSSLCFCRPGFILNATGLGCELFSGGGPVELDSGVDYSIKFPETVFSLDSVKRLTQSQAVFLEATLLLLLSWLAFCFALRLLAPLGDGTSLAFKIRWWVSRLDVCFATRHWREDQEVVKKRKTEMGGTFSMASWILFIGLFAALLYQIISNRTVEVHNVRASNEPDLVNFINDLEFNITTISSMTCSQLRGLETVTIGNPGSIEHRIASLSTFAKYSCVNTTKGPTISLRCNNCQPLRDIAYISWYFVDLPNNPASAVGFQFNLTSRNRDHEKHLSYVRGTLKNGSNGNGNAITFRGQVPSILKFNLFPRIYHNMHELKLIQPLLHDFIPGSSFSEPNELQISLQSAADGLINTTLYINFLSDYIVEIDSQNILGPVGFLADLGGLFCFSMCIFFYLLVQCEYRIKKLRNEDIVMRRIRSKRKAQDHWNKLRKYVMYTWGPSSLDEEYSSVKNDACCGVKVKSSNRHGTSDEQIQQSRRDDIRFSKSANIRSQKALGSMHSKEDEKEDNTIGPHLTNVHNQTCFKTTALVLPPPPSVEQRDPDEIKVSDLQNDLQKLYEYNVMLNEKLTTAQSMITAILEKESRSTLESSS